MYSIFRFDAVQFNVVFISLCIQYAYRFNMRPLPFYEIHRSTIPVNICTMFAQSTYTAQNMRIFSVDFPIWLHIFFPPFLPPPLFSLPLHVKLFYMPFWPLLLLRVLCVLFSSGFVAVARFDVIRVAFGNIQHFTFNNFFFCFSCHFQSSCHIHPNSIWFDIKFKHQCMSPK